ncbi:MAG: TIGR01244 family protein [Sphingomonas sp. SCN 67-18]|uniref:TIGR01244 family sulfur transferase n=1 Tax=uncultured Sphingomonas sp. TaxID=158754 RepID=UPI00086F5C75|nr:TIGR01244 family sulfur transferase [Sphingomonas sp. SCN 67-18]ODU19695.1 MAG: TIGR01244 family protein [Sphingomonas sp. SCN 67-18]
MFRRLDESILVSPQISLDQLAEAAAGGVTLVINNRPDGEDAGQPDGRAIADAAARAGMAYLAIPVTHAGFSGNQVEAMVAALDGATGPVLAYCRSGTRSTLLWALARARMGDRPDDLAAKAAGAGYDLTPIRPMLDALAGR